MHCWVPLIAPPRPPLLLFSSMPNRTPALLLFPPLPPSPYHHCTPPAKHPSPHAGGQCWRHSVATAGGGNGRGSSDHGQRWVARENLEGRA